ncbi:MAG: hypothetical protein KJ718_05515 [Nanoarchaeota archaeon]|nr:hypothetical protein [Nanoarchaeota archaeon]MBU1051981.1 hypothetical protein [Nanoarchaeota archaeon]
MALNELALLGKEILTEVGNQFSLRGDVILKIYRSEGELAKGALVNLLRQRKLVALVPTGVDPFRASPNQTYYTTPDRAYTPTCPKESVVF